VPRGASAAGVVSGKLVVVGGMGTDHVLLDSIAVYDPASNHWTNRAPIPTVRDHLTADVVGGVLYAIGGRPMEPDKNFDVVEAYDLVADRWTSRTPMPSRRGGLASAVLGGRIHTFGGETRSSVFGNHEAYDPATNRWTVETPMPTPRHGLAAVTVGDRIYVIGGGPKAGLAQTAVVEVWR
jgi:N-acetylneuraminic acid mutarotase